LLTEVADERDPSAEAAPTRARIVAAADDARRRLARDLHDGAQQRLVIASLWLKRAAAEARGTPAEPLVVKAVEQLQHGLAELRDLAHGLHPSVLSERGLAAGLESLVARSPLSVELRVDCGRVAPEVESAIYFTVAEALTNAAKHARSSHVRVEVRVVDGALAAEVADDGVGGALVTGSGLRGVVDRLDAINGTLTIESPPGAGTAIRARVPLAPRD
jgi:signal transduction histidine kinase